MESKHCFFCDKLSTSIVCDDPKCQSYNNDVMQSLEEAYRQDRKDAFRAAVRQRANLSVNQPISRISRWFYTAKCLFCILFDRHRTYNNSGIEPYTPTIEIATFHYQKLYAGWEESFVQTGHGLLTNWWYEIIHDGEWEL